EHLRDIGHRGRRLHRVEIGVRIADNVTRRSVPHVEPAWPLYLAKRDEFPLLGPDHLSERGEPGRRLLDDGRGPGRAAVGHGIRPAVRLYSLDDFHGPIT